jgi:hypothetical protein
MCICLLQEKRIASRPWCRRLYSDLRLASMRRPLRCPGQQLALPGRLSGFHPGILVKDSARRARLPITVESITWNRMNVNSLFHLCIGFFPEALPRT